MLKFLLNQAGKVAHALETRRVAQRWQRLQNIGMRIGKNVYLPSSTWIDAHHCFLISIGDNCVFGDNCAILAHDAMPNGFIDATKIGLVEIGEQCHFGFGTIIMPGVKIGPRVVVAANSVVATDIPPNSVARGTPAKVIGTLDDYLEYHRLAMQKSLCFPYKEYSLEFLTPARKKEMIEKLKTSPGYITGGYTAKLESGQFLTGNQRDETSAFV